MLLGAFLGFMVLRQPSALKAPPIRGSNVTSNSLFYASNREFSVKIGERNTNKPVIEYSLPGGNKITFAYTNTQGKLIAPVSKGNTVSFTNVAPNVDINYTTLPTGLKEEIVLKKQVPSHIFNFSLNTTNAYPESQTNALYSSTFYDQKGQYLFHFEKPFATDAKGSRTDNVSVQIKRDTKTNAYFLTLDVDRTWFESPDRVYPITIDPTIVHNTSTVFATGQLNRVKDTGSGSSPSLETYYQELSADANTAGLWHFNETSGNALDSSGNGFNLTLGTNNTRVTSILGSALNNPGTSAGATVSYAAGSALDFTATSKITVEFWLKTGSLITSRLIEPATSNTFLVETTNAGAIAFGTFGGTSVNWAGAYTADSNWHHFAITYDGVKAYLYKDGNLISSQALTAGWTSQAATLKVGGDYSYPLTGSIDELRISKVVRPPEEIRLDASRRPYSVLTSDVLDLTSVSSWNPLKWTAVNLATGDGETATPSATSNLVAQWNFNETSGTTAVSGGTCGTACNGTLTNFASTASQDQAPGTGWTAANRRWGAGALMFDGADDSVLISDNASIKPTVALTIESWVKPRKTGAIQVITDKRYSTTADPWNSYVLDITAANLWDFCISNGTAGTQTCLTSNNTIQQSTWTHVVGTYDGASIRIYKWNFRKFCC